MRASRGKKKKLDIHKTKELVKRRCATHVLIKSINKTPTKGAYNEGPPCYARFDFWVWPKSP